MGILDRLRRKKKSEFVGTPAALGSPAYTVAAPAVPTPAATGSLKAEMDLVLSQMENLLMQYEAIDARLQNMERVIKEIRSFCK